MTVSASTAVRNAMMNALVSTVGASPTIEVWSATDRLAVFSLGSTWANSAASGAVVASGLPVTATVTTTGTASLYRLLSSAGAVHLEGTVSDVNGSSDLVISRTALISGQQVRLKSWRIVAP